MNDGLVVNPRAGLTDAGPCRAPLQGWGGPRSEYLDDQTSTGRHSPVHTNDQDRSLLRSFRLRGKRVRVSPTR